MLLGRDDECARIDGLLDAARARQSSALVLRGEAGIGKTALLEYAAERATGFRVLRTLGIESEGELVFAGAQQLLGPVLSAAGDLPQPQAAALRRAFALEDGPPPDRLTICAATLGLLAAAADDRRLVCIVDDAQWLDEASAEALTFAARRLYAEGVVMLFAAREPDPARFRASGLADLTIGPLGAPAARALLAAHAPTLSEPTAERLVELTAGNPLALIEIPRALGRRQELGQESLEPPLPVATDVQLAFGERLRALTPRAQAALLLVSAGDPADPATLWRAIEKEELDGALSEAEDVGLLVPGKLAFCHPLARSVVYQSATPAARRAVHRQLASAASEPDRRAWHLASAADRPDESVADALQEAAALARARGGVAAEARALERAARLTPDGERRAQRLYSAALAAASAGRLDRGEALAVEAAELTRDPRLRADAVAQRAYLLFDRGEFNRAYELAVAEAENVGSSADSVTAAVGGALRPLWRRLDLKNAVALADRVRPQGKHATPNPDVDTQVAWVWAHAGRVDEPLALVRAAIEYAEPGTWLAVDCANVLLYLEDYDGAQPIFELAVERARVDGALGNLGYALDQLAKFETRAGDPRRAYSLELESVQLTEPLGNEVALAASLIWLGLVASMLGRDESVRHAEQGLAIAERLGDPWNEIRARGVLGFDSLANGDPSAAVRWLEPAVRTAAEAGLANPNFLRIDADLVEALIRVGRANDARDHLERFEGQAQSTGSRWALATAARCRAFLGDDAFEAALSRHLDEPSLFERARTFLCYGERLRRLGERREAREQLRTALGLFEGLGARPWAERARVELRASGERLRRRDPSAEEQLTPQELQIMLLVAEGLTNRDVGARLFLSPKTVEFHLTRIYRKLDVRSRAELVRRRLSETA